MGHLPRHSYSAWFLRLVSVDDRQTELSPPEYLEEFKQRRAVDCPDFCQIEEARACEACDVVPSPPPDPLALSAPPSGSRSEQAASTAAVRAADGAL